MAMWARAACTCGPAFELRRADDMQTLRAIAGDVAAATASVGGQFAAARAWGWRARSFWSWSTMRPTVEILTEVKALFDPEERLNPGKIITPRADGRAVDAAHAARRPLRPAPDETAAPAPDSRRR